jgi:hypothetical protein
MTVAKHVMPVEKETIMKRHWSWIRRRGVLLGLLGALLCGSGASIKMFASERPSVQVRHTRLTHEQVLANFGKPPVSVRRKDLSLTGREHNDFLLTPALLVQEAVSEGVILTYPEE